MSAPTVFLPKRRYGVLQELTDDDSGLVVAAGRDFSSIVPDGSIVRVEYAINAQRSDDQDRWYTKHEVARIFVSDTGVLSGNTPGAVSEAEDGSFNSVDGVDIQAFIGGVYLTGIDPGTVIFEGWIEYSILSWPNTFTGGEA
jgi:hypothetical protein